MAEKVLIKILSEARAGEEKENMEMDYTGLLNRRNGVIYIRYDEVADTGTGLTSNMIKIYPDDIKVEINKKGAITSHMSFVSGEKTHTFYETPFGAMNLAIYARQVDIEETQDTIHVFMDYSIDANYETVSDNSIDITVRKKHI